MYYIWTISANFPNLYWLKYDWDNNPDYLQFLSDLSASALPDNKKIIFYLSHKAKKETFLKFDYVLSDAVCLFNEKLFNLLTEIANEDIKFIKVEVFQNNFFIGFYYIPIIINSISCINNKESIYDNDVEDYTKLCFKKNH